jgi:serine-type D-Ala-D-Ala carboxypeptidase/endopeptidase
MPLLQHTRRALAVAPLLGALVVASAAAQTTFPSDSAVQALLTARVDGGRAAGIIVGLLEPDGSTRVLHAGTAGPGRTLGPESIFEIGSITKAFTGVLLADMVRRGDVALDDPVSKYLPEGVTVPGRSGKVITLAHLSSHTSGLPRLPALRPANPLNPYADYTVEQLHDFLRTHELRRDPGAEYEYSNLGAGLLGHVLALRAGMSYERLVHERILEPLGMTSTAITLTPAMRTALAAGHNARGDTVPGWDLPTLAGAGALRSTTTDMLRFANAALRGTGPLREAFDLSMQPRAQAGTPTMAIGLGWHRLALQGDTVVWHNGGTGGFRTFLGLSPGTGRAVVLLTNSGNMGADDLALLLLASQQPAPPPQPSSSDQLSRRTP